MPYKCFRCHNAIVGTRWVCNSCRHGYCKDCFMAYHWHTYESNFYGGGYGGGRIRV